MKRNAIFIFCFCLAISASAQDHFEKKMKNADGTKLVSLMGDGYSKFDYSAVGQKTLIIPSYDPKSLYTKFVLGKQYDKLASIQEKNNYYNEIWEKGIQESSFALCSHKIENVDYEKLSPEEKKNYLYLSYYQTRGYYYLILWYVDKDNTELPASIILVNDIDLGSKNDLRFAFNLLNQSISMNQDYLNTKIYADMKSAMDDDSKPKIERFYTMNTQDMQDAQNEFYNKLTRNYISEAEYTTLLLPKENKNGSLDKAMSNWSYSKYEYMPKADIEEKRAKSDSNYCYIRLQTSGSGLLATTLVYILSTENDRILYYYLRPISSNEKMEVIIPKLMEDIEGKRGVYDPNSTIVYQKIDFKSDQLPGDLKSSKIVYVNLTKAQYNFATWINTSFERKMKKYPYQFKITDDAKDIADCKYRVYLKSFNQTYKVIRTTSYSSGRTERETDYVTKELFYLYLKDLQTGECYKFQYEPNFYPNTFKEFVEAVK